MTEKEIESMPKETREICNAIAATIKLCRWVYEFALENNFTPNQSLGLSKHYMTCMLGTPKR